MSFPVTIVCVNHGNFCGRGAEYVNKLFDMVFRNLPQDLIKKFVCFTDNAEGLNPLIEARELPGNLTGWWNKIYLFKKGLFNKGERIFFLDLDTIITGPLDHIVKYSGKFMVLKDFYNRNNYNSGVMLWEADFDDGVIWDNYEKAGFPYDLSDGDQEWIKRNYKDADLFQDIYPMQVCSYKVSAQNMFPKGTKIVCFHGLPRPHDVSLGWVPEVWKIGGGTAVELETQGNTQGSVLVENIHNALRMAYPVLDKHEAHEGHAVIVGGGPSLKESIEEIRLRKTEGQTIFATNATYKFLLENGIRPDYHVMLDARPENVEFIVEDAKGIFCSHCAPNVLASCKDVTIFHPYAEDIIEVIQDEKRPCALIAGGSSVGLKAIEITYVMGFRNIHVYGMDSSYRDDNHHAYKQPLNDSERTLEITCNGVNYKAAAWMIVQVEEFKAQIQNLLSDNVTVTIHGTGLLPDVAKLLAMPAGPEEIVNIDGIYWPSLDIECRFYTMEWIDSIDKILAHVPKGGTAIQAGGNVGIWAKGFAKHFDEVHAFEPDPMNYACLTLNVTEGNVILWSCGLSDKEENVSLQRKPNNCGAHYVSGEGDLKLITIDSMNLPECSLIQLDVEGYELKALKGAEQTINKFKPVVVIEQNGLSEKHGIKPHEAADWLISKGYEPIETIRRDTMFVHKN